MTLTQEILERDNWTCQYCLGERGRATTVDHIFSKAEGRRQGIRRFDKRWCVAACISCNLRRMTYRFLPPSWEDRISELNELTPGHTWRVDRGGPVSDVFRKVHTA